MKHLTPLIWKVKAKKQSYLVALSVFLLGLQTSPVFAADPWSKGQDLAQQGITKVQGIGVITLGLAVVVTGLVYGFGGRELKAGIKKHWVAIGVAIIAVAAGPSIIEWAFDFVKN